MSKRGRSANGRFVTGGGSVTGGTGDVKPQLITANIVTPASSNQYSVTEIPVPRIILGSAGAATIMEVLKVYWYFSSELVADTGMTTGGFLSTTSIRAQSSTALISSLMTDAGTPSVFGAALENKDPGAADGGQFYSYPITVDLTDNNGNGILIATDRFFATVGMVFNSAPEPTVVKILYRMVDVDITEYVGIVAQQS